MRRRASMSRATTNEVHPGSTRDVSKKADKPSRFIKIDQNRQPLPDDATEWAAVLEPARNLMWSVAETKGLTWKKAKAAAEKLQIAGFSDWRLPSVEELFRLADRTRV